MVDSRNWWNRAARDDAHWYIATAPDPFFERGRRDVDELIDFCGLQPSNVRTLLEIGAGAGRMTRRFAELYGKVIALDVSDEMLRLGRANLAAAGNVEWVLGSGTDLGVIPDASADDVFSYITLQHIPDRSVVLHHVEEAARILKPDGRAALQVRHPGLVPTAIDLAAVAAHTAQGRRVWSRNWRGTRIPTHTLRTTATRTGATVELRPRGRRHLWILLRT